MVAVVKSLRSVALSLLEDIQSEEYVGSSVPSSIRTNLRGRPRLDIRKDQLEYLLYLGFSCPQVSWIECKWFIFCHNRWDITSSRHFIMLHL